jgi:hypothetical protein
MRLEGFSIGPQAKKPQCGKAAGTTAAAEHAVNTRPMSTIVRTRFNDSRLFSQVRDLLDRVSHALSEYEVKAAFVGRELAEAERRLDA